MAAEQEQTRTLSDVVRDRRAELGLGYRAAEARCVDPDTGIVVGRNYIERLEKVPANLQPPTPAQLRGLAAGFELPLALLQEAAGRQFYNVSTQWSASGKARAFVARFDDLEPADQDRILAMLEAFAASKPKAAEE